MARFKDRFKQLRKEAHLTQEQIAVKLNVSKGTIGNYETGEREPKDLEMLESIADLFNVDIDYLMGRTDKRPEFSLEELELIRRYRLADEFDRKTIWSLLERYKEDTAILVG